MATKAQFYKIEVNTTKKEKTYIVPEASKDHAHREVSNLNITPAKHIGWHEVTVTSDTNEGIVFEASVLGETLRFSKSDYGYDYLTRQFQKEYNEELDSLS
ncbi:hypothetical protein [Chromohalobacter sp. 296-RDG]|uniref:hypothetical protein n=1 Tax=Chromohalobacter sp. 296-RDG TaxID=2994062 RepID=UPI00246859D5|nr:hypothetical protein [Chromohalobacter sp. 296-RDG]